MGVRKQFANLGMASPFAGGVVGTVDVLAFRRQCFPRRCLSGRACTCRPELPHSPRAKLCTYFRWLLGLIGCWWSHIMNCPCPSQSSDCYFISGWAHIRCRLSKAGLQGQVCQDIYVAAHFAPIGPWVRSGIAFLTARVSVEEEEEEIHYVHTASKGL